jgi:hypothetical protein
MLLAGLGDAGDATAQSAAYGEQLRETLARVLVRRLRVLSPHLERPVSVPQSLEAERSMLLAIVAARAQTEPQL